MMPQPLFLVDSTLREGEQFAHAHFTLGQKVDIAAGLDAFGVDYLELTSPRASQKAFEDCRRIAGLTFAPKPSPIFAAPARTPNWRCNAGWTA